MALVDMEMSAEEAREEYGSCAPASTASDGDLPKYPSGLTIYLDDDALAKLGITSLPQVGTPMQLTARVEVCSTSQYQDRKGEAETSLSLQITAMELSDAPVERDAASIMYGTGGD